MIISVLMENTALNEGFHAEHGLSLWLETGKHRILFDFGQTNAFLANAQRMHIDVTEADYAILSHGHYDHSGGGEAFLALQSRVPILAHPLSTGLYYHGEKYIGLSETLKNHPRLQKTGDVFPLQDAMTLLSCRGEKALFPAFGGELSMEQEGIRQNDPFLHEQYLVCQENHRRIVVSGCSHKGIANIVHWLKPDVLIGGFHLSKVTDTQTLLSIGHALKESACTFYTGHCTGQQSGKLLKTVLGDRLHFLHAGSRIEI